MKRKKHDFLSNKKGRPVILYHGTYNTFDYFQPLSHFGTRIAAETRVRANAGFAENRNLSPIIIPVRLKNRAFVRILDLSSHEYEHWRVMLVLLLAVAQNPLVKDYIALWDNAKMARPKLPVLLRAEDEILKQDMLVPADFDFICQPMLGNLSTDQIHYELSLDNLYTPSGDCAQDKENLFNQRMIQTLESRGIGGFKYENYVECSGELSYIIFRPGDAVRMDKMVAACGKNSNKNKKKLAEIRASFGVQNRVLGDCEKAQILNGIYELYKFNYGLKRNYLLSAEK